MSGDTINGVKVVFADIVRASQTATSSESKASFASSETNKESGQELAAFKRKSATLESGAKSASGTRTDISANPK